MSFAATGQVSGAVGLRRAMRRVLNLEGIGAWLALVVTVVVSTVLVAVRTDSSLMSRSNIDIILVSAVPLGLVGIGQTIVILVGHFDLSVAGVVSLAVVLTAKVMDGDPSKTALAIGLAIASGLVVGLVNGLVVTRLHVNALIATLGTTLVIGGILNTLVRSRSGSVSAGFRRLGYGTIFTIPIGVFVLAAVFAIAAIGLARSKFGHHVYVVGGDAESARMSGIHDNRVVVTAFALCGVFAAIAGVYLASRLGSGDTGVGDRGGYALKSVAITVLGGTVLGGGRGGVFGTLAGLLIFSLLDTVFNLLQIEAFLKSILQGGIIIAAVASYSFRSERSVG